MIHETIAHLKKKCALLGIICALLGVCPHDIQIANQGGNNQFGDLSNLTQI